VLAFADGAIFFALAIGLELAALHAHRRFGHVGWASQQTVPDSIKRSKTRIKPRKRFGNRDFVRFCLRERVETRVPMLRKSSL
jgi:hypothetical protein